MTHVQPVFLLLLCFLAWGLLSRSRSRLIPFTGALGILLWSWPPVAWVMSEGLEAPYRNLQPDNTNVGAIVVLGGGVMNPRALHALDLFFQLGCKVPVLASGTGFPVSDAEVMRRQLQVAGVGPIWVEGESRSTAENAAFSAKILKSHGVNRIVLVTDAYHMRRAEMCFRKQGFDVVPAPSSFQSAPNFPWHAWLLPNSDAMNRNDRSFHEWIGIVAYLLNGSA